MLHRSRTNKLYWLNEFEPEKAHKKTMAKKKLIGNDPKIATFSPIYRTFCLFLMQKKKLIKKALIWTFLFTPNNADVKFIKICARSMNFAVHFGYQWNFENKSFVSMFSLSDFPGFISQYTFVLHSAYIYFETKFRFFFVRQLKIVSVFEWK